MIHLYLEQLELAYFEASEAFRGLHDENVWERPAERLLSIGELAGHTAYWQAMRFTGEGNEEGHAIPGTCKVQSPLIERRFAYHSLSLETPPSNEHRSMTAEQVWNDLKRIHLESVAYLQSQCPELDAPPPGWPAGGSSGSTLREILKYQIFHIGYHVGQIYSARFLLGEEPPDN